MPTIDGVRQKRIASNRYIGVDISLTATAMVSMDFFGNVTHITKGLGYPLPESSTTWEQTQRNLVIASGIVPFVANCRYTAIEGYSFSSKSSRIYQIGELGGIIRSRLMDYPDSYPNIIPPSALKKFATGKGRCKGKAPVIMGAYKKWGFEAEDDDDNVVDAYILAQMMRYHHIIGVHTDYIIGVRTGSAMDVAMGWGEKHQKEVAKVIDSLTNYQRETLMACKLY